MNIVIAGASGVIGRALVPALCAEGHGVFTLVRRKTKTAREIAWDPATGHLEPEAFEAADAVINLSGENVAAGRWSVAQRERIMRSRVDATRTLVAAIRAQRSKPRVLINASAVGFYGDRGAEQVTERSGIGQGFLPEVCLAWETHAEGAGRLNVRTVLLRFGVVLSRGGGALAKMLPLFRRGLGGRLGPGTQWMSWIAVDDVVGIVRQALADDRLRGPINVVAPQAVTNAEFTATLARVLGKPARLPAPAWALRLAFGRMAEETLLASTRAAPDRLMELGYSFRFPELEAALRAVVT